MSISASYVSDNKFKVVGDRTEDFVVDRKVRADLGSDGIVIDSVESSSYDSSNNETTVTLINSVLTSNLDTVLFGVPTTVSLPLHTHSSDAEGGGEAKNTIFPLSQVNRIARADYQSHSSLKGYSDLIFDIFIDENKIDSKTKVVVNPGRNGNVILDTYTSDGTEYYESSGTIDFSISLSFTPTYLRVEQVANIPTDEDIQFTISDSSGNSVTVTQSNISTQVDCSNFADGDITVQVNLTTSDGEETPVLEEHSVYFK